VSVDYQKVVDELTFERDGLNLVIGVLEKLLQRNGRAVEPAPVKNEPIDVQGLSQPAALLAYLRAQPHGATIGEFLKWAAANTDMPPMSVRTMVSKAIAKGRVIKKDGRLYHPDLIGKKGR
jgi:hypothetical protein